MDVARHAGRRLVSVMATSFMSYSSVVAVIPNEKTTLKHKNMHIEDNKASYSYHYATKATLAAYLHSKQDGYAK